MLQSAVPESSLHHSLPLRLLDTKSCLSLSL